MLVQTRLILDQQMLLGAFGQMGLNWRSFSNIKESTNEKKGEGWLKGIGKSPKTLEGLSTSQGVGGKCQLPQKRTLAKEEMYDKDKENETQVTS